jgi:UDP-GlcNAc:undecaprenyl-phosphate GlcNAc-1-phosphate transferase
MNSFSILATSFLVALLFFPIFIKFLKKIRFGDNPGGRRIHKKFTPSMGGLILFFSSFFSFFVWGFFEESVVDIWFFLVGAVVVLYVGLSDDIVNLKASFKLIGQTIAAMIVVIQGDIRISSFYGFLGVGLLPDYFSIAFSVLFLLVSSNAFNLIDGVDGLAGTISLIALTFFGIWFSTQGDFVSYASFSIALVGATLGFLVFNWQPAKIFMGDTGSLTLGFSIGVLVIVFFNSNEMLEVPGVWKFNSPLAMGIALIIYPLFDLIRVFIRRILNGNHPMKADKGHIHHLLIRSGMSHQKVTLVISTVQLVFVVLGLVLSSLEDNWSVAILFCLALIFGRIVEMYTLRKIRDRVLASPRISKKLKLDLVRPSQKSIEDFNHLFNKMNKN